MKGLSYLLASLLTPLTYITDTTLTKTLTETIVRQRDVIKKAMLAKATNMVRLIYITTFSEMKKRELYVIELQRWGEGGEVRVGVRLLLPYATAPPHPST